MRFLDVLLGISQCFRVKLFPNVVLVWAFLEKKTKKEKHHMMF